MYAVAAWAVAAPGAVLADSASELGSSAELAPYLQCVPYARERSGVQIYGDARTWWDQAAGRYKRGVTPRSGAVMTFRPSGNMALGHVAAVSRVIDHRTVLLDHANWSPIDGRRGQIERGVRAIDVSLANDWSQVRVWYAPLQDLGATTWPVAGFIYNEPESGPLLRAPRTFANVSYVPRAPRVSPKPSKAFSKAFASLGEPVVATPRRKRSALPIRRPTSAHIEPRDPIDAALARYGS
jgi:surface antigen